MRKNAGEMKDMDKNAPAVLPPPAVNDGAMRGAAQQKLTLRGVSAITQRSVSDLGVVYSGFLI
jgi:hypothetical protein